MEKKTYTKFDLERLQREYNNANSKRSEEVILQMMEEVKAEIGKEIVLQMMAEISKGVR